MRDDRKNGLLLIDYETLRLKADYLKRFLLLDSQGLTIGIITTDETYTLKSTPAFMQSLNARKEIILYRNSLASSVASRICTEDEAVMCLSTSSDLVGEAHQLSWGAIKIPNVPGELSRSHLMGFREMLSTHLRNHNPLNPLTLVVSLDIDETLFFYAESCDRRQILLNESVLDFLKNIIETHKDHPLEIKLVAVTARVAWKESAYLRQYHNWPFSVERVMAAFSEEISNFFQGDIPVYYTREKYTKLGELHGAEENTIVLHLDDNPDWTTEFELGTYPNIRYASVHSPARLASNGRPETKSYPEFVFPEDEKRLLDWCGQFAIPVVVDAEDEEDFSHAASAKGISVRSEVGSFPIHQAEPPKEDSAVANVATAATSTVVASKSAFFPVVPVRPTSTENSERRLLLPDQKPPNTRKTLPNCTML